MKKLLVMFATLAIVVASAADKTYHITLNDRASVNGTQLKPGDYKVHLEGDKAILKMGKTVIEAPARIQTADHKFDTTSVAIANPSSQPTISEIRIGGTNTRIVFGGAIPTGGGISGQ
jgi:hypothetical protein